MAFGNKNKSKSGSGSTGGGSKSGKGDFKAKKGTWKKLGAILESEKYSKTYFNADGYHGALLFVAKDTGKMYRVKNASFSSKDELEEKGVKGLPNFLVGNVSINLDSSEEVDLEKMESLEDLFSEDENSED